MKRLFAISTLLNEHGYVEDGDVCAQHDILYFHGPELSEEEREALVNDKPYDGTDECVKKLLELGAHYSDEGDSWAVFP